MPTPFAPLLPPAELDRLRAALTEHFTDEAVQDLLGPVGRGAHSRGDLAGVGRSVRAAGGSATATLARLFLLGRAVPAAAAAAALAPLSLAAAEAAGLVITSSDETRAALDVRPYGERDGAGWWVVSDLAADVRPDPLPADHVLGVGSAALTLAQATPRDPIGAALDLGTGCGVQALHLSRHAAAVTGTDVSARALRFAATTAALNGQRWELRRGSLLEPVAGRQFDLVVANPPFVVSPGSVEHDYRDGGLAGDEVSRRLVSGIPALLAPGGTAQLLANWIVPRNGSWQDRLTGWLAGTGCDAWVWQRELADPGEYIALWLRDAGHRPGTPEWTTRYERWAEWFEAAGVAAIGMGLVTLWRRGPGEPGEAAIVCEDVPQALEQPVAAELPAWHERQRWLARHDDAALLARPLRHAPGLVRRSDEVLGPARGPDGSSAGARCGRPPVSAGRSRPTRPRPRWSPPRTGRPR